MAERRWRRVRLALAALCIAAGLWLAGDWWIDQATVAGQPRALWRGQLPGLDLGIDAWPARPGQGGYVQLWAEPHDADDYTPLLRLPGALALPRRWQAGEVEG
jgi:hypothetical protein